MLLHNNHELLKCVAIVDKKLDEEILSLYDIVKKGSIFGEKKLLHYLRIVLTWFVAGEKDGICKCIFVDQINIITEDLVKLLYDWPHFTPFWGIFAFTETFSNETLIEGKDNDFVIAKLLQPLTYEQINSLLEQLKIKIHLKTIV